MSEVDTRFAQETRAALLDEVRSWLPAFLSAAATEQYDPAGDVRELLALDEADLRRVVAVHLCLSEPVQSFLAALADGLRRPIASSERPPVVGQAVRGAVDWGATMRSRAVAGGDRTLFVTRPARRVFDVPENRAVAWLIRSLDAYLRRAAGGPSDDDEQTSWDAQLRVQRGRLRLLLPRAFVLDSRRKPIVSGRKTERDALHPDLPRDAARQPRGRGGAQARGPPGAAPAAPRAVDTPAAAP